MAPVAVAVLHRDAGNAAMLDEDAPGFSDQPLDVRLGLERLLHPRSVDSSCPPALAATRPRVRDCG